MIAFDKWIILNQNLIETKLRDRDLRGLLEEVWTASEANYINTVVDLDEKEPDDAIEELMDSCKI